MIRFDRAALYHVSEAADISVFHPRPTTHGDAKVWAIRGSHIQNYLFPRDCPRICIWANDLTDTQDKDLLDGVATRIFIEQAWSTRCAKTKLYIYRFESEGFTLGDQNAGYMTSTQAQTPAETKSLFFGRRSTLRKCRPSLKSYQTSWRDERKFWHPA